jgi:ABC-2 type transport system permease protein
MMAAIRSEWIKLRTVRSTWVLLFVSIGLTVLLGGIVGLARRNESLDFGDTALSLLTGMVLSMFILGVSAVLLVSSEFRTGTIRPTLSAQPNRRIVFLSKLIVVAITALAIAVVMSVLALVVGRLMLATGTGAVAFEAEDWRSVAGSIVLFVLFALWGVALAFLIRHSAGAICALILWPLIGEGILLAIITGLLDKRWIMRYMPYTAALRLLGGGGDGNGDVSWTRWQGGLYFGGFVAVLLALSYWRFNKQDA